MRDFFIDDWGRAYSSMLELRRTTKHGPIIHAREVSADYDKAVQGLVEALKSIANEDYRGNRSSESIKAFHALAAFEKVSSDKGQGDE